MVGLSDIPCVGKFVDRISDATVDAFFRGLRYLFCYKQLVNVLNSEIGKVNIQEGRVSTKSKQERTDGKIIKDHVLRWKTEVDEFQEGAKEFSEKFKNRASWTCLKCLLIPNPVSRFQLGRDAARQAKRATELVKSGEELLANEIAHLSPIENFPRIDASFQDFPSRKDVYGKLWEALITDGSSLIHGIYGMPGVGKTRMAEQIWKEAKEKKIFDTVARAYVGSEGVDVIKLQRQIADHLNCHFESQDNVQSRASQLKNSLMNGGKILIILDDVWRDITLDHIIGTSFGESSSSKGSKILLTSRSEIVCRQNNCEHPVQITTLTDEEAWDLFQNTVGIDNIHSLQDETLAKEVCSKCAGLPLLIRAVGKALQFMPHNVWKDALLNLEKGNFNNIPEIDPQVYACVKLSIDRLPSEDAKLCLFLCSLFPEDADIHIMKLIQFAIGSQFIPDGETRVLAMVDILTKASLLLEYREDRIIKLHDIIRDVARYISFADKEYAFSHVNCGQRLREYVKYPKLLRWDLKSDYAEFPEDLVYTDLISTLWLHGNNHLQQFSGDFYDTFVNLRFLMLQDVDFCTEHFSLQPLGKLKMLIFDHCDIKETDASLFPKNISTLCIWECNLPNPLDLPKLEYLQKLDITSFGNEVIMVPNAISSLSSLEELHIPNGFRYSDDDAEDITLILDEIGKLTRLTSLKIYLRNFEACQGTSIFFKLLTYDISVGDRRRNNLFDSTRKIELINVKVKRDEALQSLVGRAEEVRLDGTDVDVCSIWNSDRAAFTELRKLKIHSSETMEYIARISQDEIQHSRQPRASFSKLTYLSILSCSGMKYLFCKSVAKCLVQLQELDVFWCRAMEVIVMNEGTSGDGEIINFPKLKTLKLSSLWSLRSFYREKKEKSDMSSCAQQEVALFDGMVAFPCLEYLRIQDLEISDIWGKKLHYYDDNNNNNNIVSSSSSSFCKLKSLRVIDCNKLDSCIIPHAMLHSLRNLETLDIIDCNELRNAFPPCIATHLIHLQEMTIISCEMMREIIGGGVQQQQQDIIVFPQLMLLRLEDLENLSNFWCDQNGESNTYKVKFPTLEDLRVSRCGKINLEGIELGGDDSTCPLRRLEIESDKQMQLPCKWQLGLYNLEILILDRCWSDEQKSLRFPKLDYLKVSNCGLSALFTISGFTSLQRLRTLKISGCDLLEEIVEDASGEEHAGMDAKTITLLQLESVVLQDLPNLKSFIHGANYECYMPALEKVGVRSCGLSSLFTISGFRSLQKLRTLEISGCDLLEEIVEDGKGVETSDPNDKGIIHSQLYSVTFKDLPNLKSFSLTVNCAFNMPKLKKLYLSGCPQLENFTCLNTITGSVSVYTEEHEGKAVTDLNDFIIQNLKRINLMKVLENQVRNQELETESGIVEEQLSFRKDNDRP